MKTNTSEWHSLAQRIQAIAQTGLAYATSPHDVERYGELSAIAAAMIAGPEPERIALAVEFVRRRARARDAQGGGARRGIQRKIAYCWFANRLTGFGRCPVDGLRSGKMPPNLSNEKYVRNPAISLER